MASPGSDAPNALVMPIGSAPDADVESDTVTVATTPFGKTFVLIPVARHVYEPDTPAQDRDFPAAVEAVPSIAAIETIADDGYVRVHCTPAGSLPAGEASVSAREAVPPGNTYAEDSERDTDCPHNKLFRPVNIEMPRTTWRTRWAGRNMIWKPSDRRERRQSAV
jgi:hypothetical protein